VAGDLASPSSPQGGSGGVKRRRSRERMAAKSGALEMPREGDCSVEGVSDCTRGGSSRRRGVRSLGSFEERGARESGVSRFGEATETSEVRSRRARRGRIKPPVRHGSAHRSEHGRRETLGPPAALGESPVPSGAETHEARVLVSSRWVAEVGQTHLALRPRGEPRGKPGGVAIAGRKPLPC
jgi:hypothetical protein